MKLRERALLMLLYRQEADPNPIMLMLLYRQEAEPKWATVDTSIQG